MLRRTLIFIVLRLAPSSRDTDWSRCRVGERVRLLRQPGADLATQRLFARRSIGFASSYRDQRQRSPSASRRRGSSWPLSSRPGRSSHCTSGSVGRHRSIQSSHEDSNVLTSPSLSSHWCWELRLRTKLRLAVRREHLLYSAGCLLEPYFNFFLLLID